MRTRFLNYILTAVSSILVLSVIVPRPVNAQFTVGISADPFQTIGNVYDTMSDAFWRAWEQKDKFLEDTAAVAFRNGVRTLLSQLANDVGEWVGSGGKGQGNLFHSDNFGRYLKDAAESASGVMIDEMLSSGYLKGFNLCEPNFSVQLSINLGIAEFEPATPKCKLSDLKRNWERAIRTENFLPDFRDSFNVGENDISVALSLQQNLIQAEQDKKEASILDRLETGGWKGVSDIVSGVIKTPGSVVRSTLEDTNANASSGELAPTDSIIADSVDIFLNAVARTLLKNLIEQGLSPSGGSAGVARADLMNPYAQRGVEGAVAASARLAQSINPSFAVPGRYNVVSQLVECIDPNNPGVNNCVIDDNFATAINRRLTIRQAVDEGLIRGDQPFGFISKKPQSLEPSLTEGIPYRSILILRTYRIVPVGWEIAARYIGEFEDRTVTLNQLLNEYSSLTSNYAGLVDPNWVLVPPDSYCKLAGPGPEIVYSTTVAGYDTNKDGDFDDVGDSKPVLQVQRDANYCADEQTCIATDDSGACKFYGYCLEERPSLEFEAASCEPKYSTCTTLKNLDTGTTVSYLLNTVDFADCTANSVGCKKYASWQRLNVPTDSDIRWDADRIDLRPVYLNSRAEECDASDAGCHAYIRVAGQSDDNTDFGDIQTKLDTLTDNDTTNDQQFGGTTSQLHLKRAPEWMGCRGCQAAGLGDGDKTIVDITDVNVVNGWRSGCGAETKWPCDNGSVSAEDLEQVLIAYEQGTCSTECRAYAPFCSAAQVGCMAYKPTNGNPTITAVSGEQCPAQCVGFDVYTQTPTFFEKSVDFAEFIPSTAQSCQASEAGCTAFTNLSKEGQGGEAREYYQSIRLCQLPDQGATSTYYTWEGSDDTGFQLRAFELLPNGGGAPCTSITWASDGKSFTCSTGDPEIEVSTVPTKACDANIAVYNPDCRQFYTVSGNRFYRLLSETIVSSPECVPLRKTRSNLNSSDSDRKACDGTNADGVQVGGGSNGYWDTGSQACIYQALTSQSKSCSASVAGCRLYQGGTSANYQTLLSVDFEKDAGGFRGGQLSSVSANVGGHSYSIDAGSSIRLSLVLSPGQNNLPGKYRVSFYARRATPGATTLTAEVASTPAVSQPINIDDTWRQRSVNEFSVTTSLNQTTDFVLTNSGGGSRVYIDNVVVTTSVDTFAVIKNSWKTPASCFASSTIQNNIDLTASVPVIDCSNGWEGVESGVLPTVDYQIRAIAHGDASDPCIPGEVCEGDFDADGEVQVDEITLLTSFLIGTKSWQCYTPPVTALKPLLGCQQYQVSNGTTQSIHEFGASCEPKFVGCEALIDTQNLTTGTNPYAEAEIGDVTVREDFVDYLVNQSQYRCNGAQQGCTTLGLSGVDPVTQDVKWSTVNLLNNPDRYSSILCGVNEVECAAFTDNRTTYYFKDPKNKACEYRTDKPVEGWYRAGSSAVSPDCASGVEKTFAPGGAGVGPTPGWVGLCPAAVNSCTEYIDPRSDGNPNLLENSRFVLKQVGSNVPINWQVTGRATDIVTSTPAESNKGLRIRSKQGGGSITDGLVQSQVRFEPNTLYVLSANVEENNEELESAFVGLTSCSFESRQVRPGINCAALGGTATSPPTEVQVDVITAMITNMLQGCEDTPNPPTRNINGYCAGDINNDKQVTVDELITATSVALGTMVLQCGEGVQKPLFESPDNSLVVGTRTGEVYTIDGIPETTRTLVMGAMGKPKADAPLRLSSRFMFKTTGPVRCDVVIGTAAIMDEYSVPGSSVPENRRGHWFKEVSLRTVNSYYQLASRVDKNSCAGNVNNADCVSLNERSVDLSNIAEGETTLSALAGYTPVRFDADNSNGAPYSQGRSEYGSCASGICNQLPGSPSCRTDVDCQLHYDSNVIVKVTPTRQCNAWLSCRTTRTVLENGVTKQVCLEVESCLAVNDKGECIRRLPEEANTNLSFNKASIDKLKNLSGLSRAGFVWDEIRFIEGTLPVAQMSQLGTAVPLINGNFELYSPAGEPIGWIGWNNGANMKVIADPVSAENKVGISYPMEGRGLLEVNASGSSFVVAGGGTVPVADRQKNATDLFAINGGEYVVSAMINTRQLAQGEAVVQIMQYSDSSNNPTVTVNPTKLTLSAGQSWSKVVRKITVPSGVKYVRLQLAWSQSNSGNYHIDDIQIQAGLRYSGDPERYEPQSCRLYPTPDAPSCEYYNDSGRRVVGKRGYCITPDPRNINYCLQWWPVASVTGEDINESRAGYEGAAPLYYCLDTRDSFLTVIQPENARIPSIGDDKDPQKFTSTFVVSEIRNTEKGQVVQIIGNGHKARQKNGDEYRVAVLPTDPTKSIVDGYALGGLIDKSGPCTAMDGGAGCEALIWAEASGGSKDDGYEVSVMKNGERYAVTRWCETTAEEGCRKYGTKSDPFYNEGQVAMWIDLAWVKDSKGNQVSGPFDTFVLRSFSADGSDAEGEYLGLWLRPTFSCNVVAQVVAPNGQNKAYTSRVANNTTTGPATPPEPLNSPSLWDTFDVSGRQALFSYPPQSKIASAGKPYSCNVPANTPGSLYDVNSVIRGNCAYYGGNVAQTSVNQARDTLNRLFVETYGMWQWQPSGSEYSYQRSSTIADIAPPTTACSGTTRPVIGHCGIAPQVGNVLVNKAEVMNIGSVTLSFSTNVDKDQLPLVSYRVDWGDGTFTTQSGLKLQNRTTDNPISLTHNYSYDQLVNIGKCTSGTTCTVKPRVQIIDNWGWCNGESTTGHHVSSGQCSDTGPGWKSFEGTIRISP